MEIPDGSSLSCQAGRETDDGGGAAVVGDEDDIEIWAAESTTVRETIGAVPTPDIGVWHCCRHQSTCM